MIYIAAVVMVNCILKFKLATTMCQIPGIASTHNF